MVPMQWWKKEEKKICANARERLVQNFYLLLCVTFFFLLSFTIWHNFRFDVVVYFARARTRFNSIHSSVLRANVILWKKGKEPNATHVSASKYQMFELKTFRFGIHWFRESIDNNTRNLRKKNKIRFRRNDFLVPFQIY